MILSFFVLGKNMGMTASVYEVLADSYAEVIERGLEALDFEETNSIDLDKAWHAISYLVSGKEGDGFFLGGTIIGSGEEQCIVFSIEDVKSLCETMNADKQLAYLSKFNADAFNQKEIYPGTWDSWSRDGYLKPKLSEFACFLEEVTKSGNAVAVIMC